MVTVPLPRFSGNWDVRGRPVRGGEDGGDGESQRETPSRRRNRRSESGRRTGRRDGHKPPRAGRSARLTLPDTGSGGGRPRSSSRTWSRQPSDTLVRPCFWDATRQELREDERSHLGFEIFFCARGARFGQSSARVFEFVPGCPSPSGSSGLGHVGPRDEAPRCAPHAPLNSRPRAGQPAPSVENMALNRRGTPLFDDAEAGAAGVVVGAGSPRSWTCTPGRQASEPGNPSSSSHRGGEASRSSSSPPRVPP